MRKNEQREEGYHIDRIHHLGLEEGYKVEGNQRERHKIHILMTGLFHTESNEGRQEEDQQEVAVPVELREYPWIGIIYGEKQDNHKQKSEQCISCPQENLRASIAYAVLVFRLVGIK